MPLERPTSGLNILLPVRSDEIKITTLIPLFHAAWLFAVGIALAHWLWFRPSLTLIALAPTAVLCCIAALRAQRIVWLPLAALWWLLGAWCGAMEPQPAADHQLAAMSDGLARTIEGTIVQAASVRNETLADLDAPAETSATQRIDVQLATIESVTDSEDLQQSSTGKVRLTVRWPIDTRPQAFECGTRIRAVARLLLPQEYRDPDVWSRSAYLLEQGITSTATVDLNRVERTGSESTPSISCRIASLQQSSSARILALPILMKNLPPFLRLNADDAVMLAAMTTGDRTYLTHSLRAGFERTGSFHMLVVSGFHLAIVAGCFFWIARRIHLPRVPATFATIAASFAYALFTGFATPVQRSLWMVTLYLVGRLFFRDRSPLNTIGFASLCLLAVSPNSLFDSSLQMTLLAVVAIAGIAAPLLEKSIHPYINATRDLNTIALDVKLAPTLAQFRVILRMIAIRLRRVTSPQIAWNFFPWLLRFVLRCVELIVISCVVELAMALPMAIYFHRITVFALPVNIIVFPLLLVLMPAALLTLVTLAVWPPAAVVPGAFVALLLHFGVWLVHLFGSLSLGNLRIPAPLLWQQLLFYALLALAMILARESRWLRRMTWAALALAAIAAVLPRPIDHPQNALLVEAIDVGQGDSLLVITPDGKTMLMDGGGFGGGPRQATQDFDIGEEVVSPTLWARGIRHLDVVTLSHAHSDHMGGLPAVLANFHPDELWVGNNPQVPAYHALLAQAQKEHIRVRALRAGDGLTLGSTAITVLAPFRNYQPGPEPANNDSLVLHVAYGTASVLLEGDAEAPIENAMLSETDLQSTLLKVGHHGSVSSTQPEFLTRVAPQWAIISCGLRNRYGHPRREVLQELESAKVRTFSTDINGAVCFELKSSGVQAQPLCGISP